MVPAQWRRNMISINFQPFNKSMTEVIEYMEKLEVLEATNKQSGTKKGDKEKSEDKTGKSKNKTMKFRFKTCFFINFYFIYLSRCNSNRFWMAFGHFRSQ